MPVSISIHLFEAPGWELGTLEDVTPAHLRYVAMNIQARLHIAADALEKLLLLGWKIDPIGTYEIHLVKTATPTEAAQELEGIGLLYLISTITTRN